MKKIIYLFLLFVLVSPVAHAQSTSIDLKVTGVTWNTQVKEGQPFEAIITVVNQGKIPLPAGSLEGNLIIDDLKGNRIYGVAAVEPEDQSALAVGASRKIRIHNGLFTAPTYNSILNFPAGTYAVRASAYSKKDFGDFIADPNPSNNEIKTQLIVAKGNAGSGSSSLSITSPNTPTSYKTGDVMTVAWNSNLPPHVKLDFILYTTKDGALWDHRSSMGTALAYLKTFQWHIPSNALRAEEDSEMFKVRAHCSTENMPYVPCDDISDVSFVIANGTGPQPELHLTSPYGGETWLTSKSQTVTWKSVNIPKKNTVLIQGHTNAYGDFMMDGQTDMLDVEFIKKAVGTVRYAPNNMDEADINSDGQVTQADVDIALKNIGKSSIFTLKNSKNTGKQKITIKKLPVGLWKVYINTVAATKADTQRVGDGSLTSFRITDGKSKK